ncbi:MAG: hypothetical protein Q8O14_04650 [bacterium]|nr:hypothetical protein [bacterium]
MRSMPALVLLPLLAVAAHGGDCLRCHDLLPQVPRKEVLAALRRTAELGDNAIAVQDRGELGNYASNFGNMSDYHMWGSQSLHWPSDANDETHYSFGLGLVVAAPGNVVESCLNSTTGLRDWTPAAGSLGGLFSGALRATDGTPFLAHSHLPETWPAAGWPGAWREEYVTPVPNPAFPRRQVPGEFTSDGDSWAVFDDRENPRGALGLEVRQSGYSYGRPYADHHLSWRSVIHNRSDRTLDSLYAGYYAAFRPDFDFVDRIGLLSTADLGLPFGRGNDVVYVWDVNARNDGAWVGNERPPGLPALLVTETPRHLGVTDFHHFQADRRPDTDARQWAVISSQSDLLDDPGSFFHSPDGRGRIDACDEGTLTQAYGAGSRLNFFVMSGPFSLAPGDSVVSACTVLLGEGGQAPGQPGLDDLRDKLATAWDMYWRTRYAGPGAPPMPRVAGRALPGGARLWWEALPSEGADDFEGYRVYRSLDQGASWGAPITDAHGRRVAWVPLATFDRVDGIRGPDPNGPTHLGTDSGLAHHFTDTGLVEGRETWYCVTAYSTGQEDAPAGAHLPSLENPLGRSPLDLHTVSLVPGAVASDQWMPVEGVRILQPEAGICDAAVTLDVVDPWALPADDWLLEFLAPAAGDSVARFHLIRVAEQDTVFQGQRVPTAGEAPLPVTAGFRLGIRDVAPGSRSLGWNEDSPCTFDWWMEKRTNLVNEYPEYVVGADDWRIEVTLAGEETALPVFLYYYTGLDTTLAGPPSPAPIRVWRRPVDSGEWLDASAHVWVEDLRLYFPNLELLSPLGWDLAPGGLAGSRQRRGWETYTDALILRESDAIPCAAELLLKTNNFDWALDARGDTLRGLPPRPGDVFTILTNKPLREGLRYSFRTDPPAPAAAPPGLHVRAVPDPYVAGHVAEAGSGGHRLYFTGLPGACTLRIYTVAGDWVRTLEHDDPASDTLAWDLRNADRQHVAYGLYVFHVSDRRGREQTGRFLVIR